MIHATQAQRIANEFLEGLQPHCERAEIAGSLRRRVSNVKDIEVVCLVTVAEEIERDLFEEEIGREEINMTFEALPGIMAATGWQIGDKDGDRYKQLVHPQTSLRLDLFTVSEIRRWGACFVIRTGPVEFNIELMKFINRHGQHVHNNLLHDHAKIWRKLPGGGHEGIPCDLGDTCALIVPTLTEASFFKAVNLPQVSPDMRSVKWLKRAVSQRIRGKAMNRSRV